MSDEQEVQAPSKEPAEVEVEEQATGSEEQESAEQPEKPKGNRVQKRISELTAKLRERERELAEIQAKRDAPKPPEKPKRDDYDDYEQYNEALVDWRVEQRLSQAEQQRQQREQYQQAERAQQELRSAYAERREQALAEDAEYEEIEDVVGSSVSEGVAVAIMLADNAPDIVRHLYAHEAELQKVNSLPPAKAAIAIGRLEERLLKDKAARSAAPKPLSTPRTGRAGAPDPLSDKADTEAWMKARTKQLRP